MKKSNLLIVLLSFVFCLSANAGEKIYFVHTDQLGTPHALTDDAQNTVWKVGDDPFGNATPAVADIANNIRFPGQYFDVESGLHYNWNRYYDPRVGRYVTSDPIGLSGGMNTFGYVGGNPLYWVDPTGLRGSLQGITTGTSSNYPRLSPGQQLPTFDGGGQVYAGQRGSWVRGTFYPFLGDPYIPPTANEGPLYLPPVAGPDGGNIIPFPTRISPNTPVDDNMCRPGSKCKFTGLVGVTLRGLYGMTLQCQYRCPRTGLKIRNYEIGFRTLNPTFLCPNSIPE